ncbi:MAG: FMN-binding glutamate synthase family protein, partial [Deltaproteobacteria bacterium]|nr:FMN-binding glutamate synthase family protein [Deltaproteobacteria bacterium]
GSNIEGALHPERKEALCGNWDKLPKTVSDIGEKAEEIFASYFDVQKKVGKKEMKNIPYGAIAFYTMADKLACGLQQLMAGARKFSLDQIERTDLFSANRETARETGIPHVSDINNETALKILNS